MHLQGLYDRAMGDAATWHEQLASRWRPSAGWRSTIEPAVDALARDSTDLAAWAQVVMMLGDTRAAPFALVVAAYVRTLPGGASSIAPHLDLCMLDLGLARADGPVRLGDLGKPGATHSDPADLDTWLATHLEPFDGELVRAAQWILALALTKVSSVPS